MRDADDEYDNDDLLEGKKGITKRTRGRREEKSRSRFQTPGDGWENAVIFV
jgi:hypothetical protein